MTLHFNSGGLLRFWRPHTTHRCQALGCRRPFSGVEDDMGIAARELSLYVIRPTLLYLGQNNPDAEVLLLGIAASQSRLGSELHNRRGHGLYCIREPRHWALWDHYLAHNQTWQARFVDWRVSMHFLATRIWNSRLIYVTPPLSPGCSLRSKNPPFPMLMTYPAWPDFGAKYLSHKDVCEISRMLGTALLHRSTKWLEIFSHP